MNKPLDATELKALEAAFPVTEPKLTREQKLSRLAMLVREGRGDLALHHNLEYRTSHELGDIVPMGALRVARDDETFRADGLKGRTVLDVRDYLELQTHEMHEFSCDCGGEITRARMADRIQKLAGVEPTVTQPSAGFPAQAVACAVVGALIVTSVIFTLAFA